MKGKTTSSANKVKVKFPDIIIDYKVIINDNIKIINACNNIIYKRILDGELNYSQLQECKRSAKDNLNNILSEEDRQIKPRLRYDILHRDNFTCQYCGRKAGEVVLHIDHMKPFSKGGKSTKDNLITSCEECNIGKSNKYDTSGN